MHTIFTHADYLSLEMEIHELKLQINSLQQTTNAKIDSILDMQQKILRKCEIIQQTIYPYPPPPPPPPPPVPAPPVHAFPPFQRSPTSPPPSPFSTLPFTPVASVSSIPPNVQQQEHQDELYTAPEPLPIKFSGTSLPSSEIPRERLLEPKYVIRIYRELAAESITKFALKLVHKAYFGSQILKRCTVMGEQEREGLPRAELTALKQAIFNELPRFWHEREKFEPLWNKCVDAINAACRRERANERKARLKLE